MATFDDTSEMSLSQSVDSTRNADVSKDESYATTNSYVTRKTHNVTGLEIVTITPKVSGGNNADLKLQITTEDVTDATDTSTLTFVDHTEKTALTSSDIDSDNTITLYPKDDGITVIRTQAKSNVTDSSATLSTYIRFYSK